MLQRVVLNCPGLCSPVPATSVVTSVYFRISRIPLARFFLKHQKISNHEWIRINTNFSYLGLPASDFHECQFVVKPSVGPEPRHFRLQIRLIRCLPARVRVIRV
jgi:hypothetical protein